MQDVGLIMLQCFRVNITLANKRRKIFVEKIWRWIMEKFRKLMLKEDVELILHHRMWIMEKIRSSRKLYCTR